MKQWMQVFVVCMWSLILVRAGNTIACAEQPVEYPSFVNMNSIERMDSVALSNGSDKSMDYLLSSQYINLLLHPAMNHFGNTYDFKSILRIISPFLLHKTDYQPYKLHKLTHTTHPYMCGCVDYYIYALERILI